DDKAQRVPSGEKHITLSGGNAEVGELGKSVAVEVPRRNAVQQNVHTIVVDCPLPENARGCEIEAGHIESRLVKVVAIGTIRISGWSNPRSVTRLADPGRNGKTASGGGHNRRPVGRSAESVMGIGGVVRQRDAFGRS